MLWESNNQRELLAVFASDIVRGFTIRHFCETAESDRVVMLVDDPAQPHVLLILAGAELMVAGAFHCLNPALADLLAGNVTPLASWPTPGLVQDWQEYKRRHVFFSSSSLASWRAARIAGFEAGHGEHEEHLAYQWHWQGAARFGSLVQHQCRTADGLELLQHMKLGVWYANEGDYVERCLTTGPSFVCEVPDSEYAALLAALPADAAAAKAVALDDELSKLHGPSPAPPPVRQGWVPVSWACTHLNGTMGMIYTPPALRRFGFAHSLGAFQIDTMLAREGIACCHIIDTNTPSMRLAQRLGGTLLAEPVVWRTVYWPGEAPGASLESASA